MRGPRGFDTRSGHHVKVPQCSVHSRCDVTLIPDPDGDAAPRVLRLCRRLSLGVCPASHPRSLSMGRPALHSRTNLTLSWHLAGGRLIGCNCCKRGVDGLSRIWVFQIGWNGIFLAGALLGGRKPRRCNVNISSRWSRPSACAAMAPRQLVVPPTTDAVLAPSASNAPRAWGSFRS
jgi:hypothetical protein